MWRLFPPYPSVVVLIGLTVASGCDSVRLPTWEARARAEPSALSPSIPQKPIQFIRSYTRGFEKARKTGKPMLVFFTARDCIYSQAMAEETFAEDTVAALSRQFVCIWVDAEEEPAVCEEFRVDAYPTVQFMSPRGVPLNRFTGKRLPKQLILQMRAALEAIALRAGYLRQTTVR